MKITEQFYKDVYQLSKFDETNSRALLNDFEVIRRRLVNLPEGENVRFNTSCKYIRECRS